MRLSEEAKYIKSEIWILAFLFISSVLIQIADDRINSYQQLLTKEILKGMNLFQRVIALKIQAESSFYKQIFPFNHLSDEGRKNYINSMVDAQELKSVRDPKTDKLLQELKRNSISIKEYHTQMVKNVSKEVAINANKYNSQIMAVLKLQETDTPWKFWKQVFVSIQFICIVIIASIYGVILRDILSRDKKYALIEYTKLSKQYPEINKDVLEFLGISSPRSAPACRLVNRLIDFRLKKPKG